MSLRLLFLLLFLLPAVSHATEGLNTADPKTPLPLGAGDAEIMRLVNQDENGNVVQGVKIGATTAPKAKLDVEGGVKVGMHSGACNSDTKGTLSFFASDPYTDAAVNAVYYCNGTQWVRSKSDDFCAYFGGVAAYYFAGNSYPDSCPLTSASGKPYYLFTRQNISYFSYGDNGSYLSAKGILCCTSPTPSTYTMTYWAGSCSSPSCLPGYTAEATNSFTVYWGFSNATGNAACAVSLTCKKS